jgi:hypothetical protein
LLTARWIESRPDGIQQSLFRDRDRGMLYGNGPGTRSPRHDALPDARQIRKEPRLVEDVAYEGERLIAQQDHGQSRAIHRFQINWESSFAE